MDFCVSIATQLILDQVKNGSSENILMSPMSINMMLNMVASGSGGKTLEQFKEFLGSEGINDFNDKSSIMMSLLASETAAASSSEETETTKPMPTAMFDGAPQNPMPWESPYSSLRELPRKKRQRRPPLFSLAKALWVDNGFPLIPSFKDITESIYKAQVKNVDFRTQLIEDKGLTRPFDPMEADFTNMSSGSNVFISRILHKSHIEVNAEGTEAAAVTFVEESDLFGSALDWSPPPPLPSFVADHPFMFMVVEEFSKLVIFSGAVLNPNE